MLQRNLPGEVKARKKSEYKEWKKVREWIEETKRRMDEEFGRKLSANFSENKELFWKEVKRVRGGLTEVYKWRKGYNNADINKVLKVREQSRTRRKSEYKEWKKKVRELIEKSKRSVDEEFGRKLSAHFSKNKKLFWKVVKRVRGGERGGGVRMMGEDGELVGGERELKGLWEGYFEQLMNNEAEGEAVVTIMGIETGRGRVPMQREVDRLEVQKAIAMLKCGKSQVWMK